MFTQAELEANTHTAPQFIADKELVTQVLIAHKLGRKLPNVEGSTIERLRYFVEAVLASAPAWSKPSTLIRTAAEFAESLTAILRENNETISRLSFRSALLYELSGHPAIAQALLNKSGWPPSIRDLIGRHGRFNTLGSDVADYNDPNLPLVEQALSLDSVALADFQQGTASSFEEVAAPVLYRLASGLSLGISCTELAAFLAVLRLRSKTSTRSNVADEHLFASLVAIKFPVEMWGAQIEALHHGLLDSSLHAWGLSSPTGTGKTFLTRLLILDASLRNPDTQVLYIVPSRALVQEVATSLSKALAPAGITVTAVTPQLVEADDEERERLQSSSVLVLTPEKADMLLRIGIDFIKSIGIAIIDEAHHIESGNRGILLELYLLRLSKLAGPQMRFVFLSAVTPNIQELVNWMGGATRSVRHQDRATRMRVGRYLIEGQNKSAKGVIDYINGPKVTVVENPHKNIKDRLIDLALAVRTTGPILTVAKGKRECEILAEMLMHEAERLGILTQLSIRELESPVSLRLDSRLEREMYPTVLLRNLLRNRIAYHHAGLPPRVRISIEEAIRCGMVDFVFATTTLAEGVNFPFSSVIIESLALTAPPSAGRPSRLEPVTPRMFWNIAGRAGRPGHDREGQVILFMPGLGLDKLGLDVHDYVTSDMQATDPVRSALAKGILQILSEISSGNLAPDALAKVRVSDLPEQVAGTVNLIRVGLVHGRASRSLHSDDELLEGSFALQEMDEAQRKISTSFVRNQGAVVDGFLGQRGSPSATLVAELGLSLETMSELHEYVKDRYTQYGAWGLESMGDVLRGGAIVEDSLKYIINPVAKRIAELGGGKLGAFMGDIIGEWVSGRPFVTLQSIRARGAMKRLEDYIHVIYTRVQYLLPWGIYALDRLVEEACVEHRLQYGNQLRSIAYLVDAGVPNLDALRLVGLDFERVDATRLSRVFRREKSRNKDADLLRWLTSSSRETIVSILRGDDGRRLDSDLWERIDGVRKDLKQRAAR